MVVTPVGYYISAVKFKRCTWDGTTAWVQINDFNGAIVGSCSFDNLQIGEWHTVTASGDGASFTIGSNNWGQHTAVYAEMNIRSWGDAKYEKEFTMSRQADGQYVSTCHIYISVKDTPTTFSRLSSPVFTGSYTDADPDAAKCLSEINAVSTVPVEVVVGPSTRDPSWSSEVMNVSYPTYGSYVAYGDEIWLSKPYVGSCPACEDDCTSCKTGNHGEPFLSTLNGVKACLSCANSGGPLTIGGRYYVSNSSILSDMGYGWKNDFEAFVHAVIVGEKSIDANGNITESIGISHYIFSSGKKSFAFSGHGDVYCSQDEGSRQGAQIIPSEIPGNEIIRVKDGDLVYEFEALSMIPRGRIYAKRIIQHTREETDGNGVRTYEGAAINCTYQDGRLSAITSDTGETYTFHYNTEWLLESVRNQAGENLRTFTYDTDKNLVSRWQIGLGTTYFTYDSQHLLTSITKPGGIVNTFAYNSVIHYRNELTETGEGQMTFAKYEETENAYTGPFTQKNYVHVEGGESYTEYRRPIRKDGATVIYATSRRYDPVYALGAHRYRILEENGSETNEYRVGLNDNLLISSSTSGGGKSVTRSYSYSSDDLLTSVSSSYDGAPAIVSTANKYDDYGRIVSAKGTDGVETVTEYPSGENTRKISSTYRIADGNVIDRTTYEYYPDTAPVHQRFNLRTETRHPTPDTSYTITYDYIQNDTDNPQNNGRLAKKTYQDLSCEEWSYGCCDVSTYRNRSGGVTTYVRDAAGRALSVTEPTGARTEYTYDGAGRILTTKLPAGGTVTNTYNVQGNLAREDFPDGTSNIYNHDVTGLLLSQTTRTGLVLTYIYSDTDGSLLKVGSPDGDLNVLTYDGLGRISTVKDSRGLILTLQYNNLGKAYKVVWPDNSSIEETYNDKGQVTAFKDRLNNTSGYEYDTFGRMTARVLPNSLRADISYDALSRILTRTLNDGSSSLTTGYTRNIEGNVTGVALPDSTTQSYSYADGLLTSKTDRAGKTWSYSYFPDRTLKSITAPGGIGTLFDSSLNANGQISSIQDQASCITSYTYDSIDRIVKVTMPDSTFYQTGYAAAGANSIQDRGGRTTGIAYDSYGRRTGVTDPKSQTNAFEYNLAGDLTKLTDARTSQTNWQFDGEGNMTRKIYADSSNYEYTYDKNGNVISRKDAKNATTGYSYNSIGQLTTVNYPNDTDVSFVYDNFGRITQMTDAAGTTAWTYDAATGRLTSENGPFGNDTVSYTYDAAGRKASMSVNGVPAANYTYDDMGRLSSAGIPAGSFSYTYLGASSKVLTVSLNGSVIVTNTYDSLGRLSSKNNVFDQLQVSSYQYQYNSSDERTQIQGRDGSPNCPLYSIDYSYDLTGQVTGAQKKKADNSADNTYRFSYYYDPSGNPLQRISQGQERNYTFNNLNQFTSATAPSSTDIVGKVSPGKTGPFNVTVNGQAAEADLQGSFVKRDMPLQAGQNTFTVNTTDRFNRTDSDSVTVTLGDAPAFTHDANGNLTSDGLWQYSYDDENQLVSVAMVTPVAGSKKIDNVYDGLGRRRVKTVSTWNGTQYNVTSIEKFVYDGWNLAAVLNSSGSPVKGFAWGVDLSGSEQGAGGVGGLLAEASPAGICIPFYDGNGNITSYVDVATSAKVAEYGYDPFGRIVAATGLKANDFSFRFSTKFFDTETGLVYYGYRFYSPELGRWMNRDRIEEMGGYNLYAMCFNNPLYDYDFLGWAPEVGGGGYVGGIGNFFKGLTWTGPKNLATGIANAAAHPIDTGKGLANAAMHPVDTAKAIGNDYYNKAQSDEGMGEIGFDASMMAIPLGGVFKYLSKLKQLKKLEKCKPCEVKSMPETPPTNPEYLPSPYRYTQEGESFIRYESGNPDFSKVTPAGGVKPGTYAAPASDGIVPPTERSSVYNLPDSQIPRTNIINLQPPAGTPIVGPRPVSGGTGNEVNFWMGY